MATAILKTDGTAVNIDDLQSPIFDLDGFLIRFLGDMSIFNKPPSTFVPIRYHQQAEFRIEHRDRAGLEGYYEESQFLRYLDGTITIDQVLTTYQYPFFLKNAKIGDVITVSRMYYGVPYEYYYKTKKYTFNIEAAVTGNQPKKYKDPVFNNYKIIDYEIAVPNGATSAETDHDENNSDFGGSFYWKNFGNVVNAWTISDLSKQQIKKLATAISLRINYIIKEIIPLILNPADLGEVEALANSINYDPDSLGSDLKKAIFFLLRSWGYFYQPNSTLPQRNTFDPVFSLTPDYDEYSIYYFGLVEFYNTCYTQQKELAEKDDDEKLDLLIKLLPAASISLFPFTVLRYFLASKCLYKVISSSDQEFIIKITAGITLADTDVFLDFLLEKQNGITTNFETLYTLLSDNILSRMVIPSWIVTAQTYRKCFVYTVYNRWLESKYNFNFIPSDVSPVFGNINPGAYFIVNPDQFVLQNVLTFTNKDNNTGSIPINTDVKFSSNFDGSKLQVNAVTTTTKFYESEDSFVGIPSTEEKPFGKFHLYQPVSLVGFQANAEFSIPQKTTIPAFLFHYVEEYGRFSDFDAKIALGINLSIDILLAYFTGGDSLLEDLSYLQRFSKIGQALRNTLPATEAVELWRGLSEGSQVFSLAAGSVVNFQNYLIATENNPAKRVVLEKVQRLFLSLLLLSATTAAVTGAQAVKTATEILDLLPTVPSGTLSDDMIGLLTRIKGDGPVTTALFENELSNLVLKESNSIYPKFIPFTQQQKLAFREAFQDLDQKAWNAMNKIGAKPVDNWLTLYNLGIDEASKLTVITKQKRVQAFIRYYAEPDLELYLKQLNFDQRIAFLDDFGEADDIFFTRLTQEPRVISKWGEANGAIRAFAKTDRFTWIENTIYDIRYSEIYIGEVMQPALPDSYILENYGNIGITLRNIGDDVAETHLNGGDKIKQKVVTAVFVDTKTGAISEVFTNYTKTERQTGNAFENWLKNDLHPNIRERYEQALERYTDKTLKSNYTNGDINRAGAVGYHAEFRSLNDLAIKRWGNVKISEAEFDSWLRDDVLGYVRDIKPNKEANIIKKPCINCYYFVQPAKVMRR